MTTTARDPGLAAALAAVNDNMSELARRIGVSPQAIQQWERVPLERVPAVEEATGIPRETLRPDHYRRRIDCVRHS